MQVALFLIAACVAPIGAAHLLTEPRLDSSGKVRQLKKLLPESNTSSFHLIHSKTAHHTPRKEKKRKSSARSI